MKFATFASANISHLRSKYFTAKRFHLPARANFVEKPTCRNKSVFLVEPRGIEPLSENLFIQLSPDAVHHLDFPSPDAGGQASVRVAILCVIPSIANGGCTVIAEMTPERRPRYSCGGRAAQRQRQQRLGCQSNVRVVVYCLRWGSLARLPQRDPLTVWQNPRRNHCGPISGGAGRHCRGCLIQSQSPIRVTTSSIGLRGRAGGSVAA